jgi:UDP-2,3-diacylglucosamine hydrolase
MSTSQPDRAAFVSDLHLINGFEPNAGLFLRFLDQLSPRRFTHLFLLGDVFDFWIADHQYFSDRFAPILAKLREIKAAGIEIHYFEGNHDLDLRPYFEEKIGIPVHEEAYSINLAGRKLRLEHGDQMDPTDRDYLFLRWLLRTPSLRWLGRHIPGQIVSWIGATASQGSRGYTTRVRSKLAREAVELKLLAHARSVRLHDPFDILIAGHVHVPFNEKLEAKGARVVNLGTWLEQPLLFELSHESERVVPVADFLGE